jgi:chemotaxis protein MotB
MNIGDDLPDVEEEGGGAENYFVSLTDLMTGVVFIFVILLASYIVVSLESQKDLKEEKRENDIRKAEIQKEREFYEVQKAALEKEKKANEIQRVELEEEKTANKQKEVALDAEKKENREQAQKIDALAKLLRDRESTRREMLDDLVKRLRRKGVTVKLDSDNGIIRLPEDLLFDSGSADLRVGGRNALKILGRELIKVIDKWAPPGGDFRLESLFVEGHTDNIPIKTAEFSNNWELSAARAVNTSLAIVDAAPRLVGLRNQGGSSLLGVSGYGENRPVAANGNEIGRGLNRRIDIRFIVAYPTEAQFREVQDILGKP